MLYASDKIELCFILLIILLGPSFFLPTFSYILAQENENNNKQLIGVAMKGVFTRTSLAKDLNQEPSSNYFEESFKLLSQGGFNHARFLFYWESYVKNPEQFMNELDAVAKAADKWNISVIYDNHQWHTSSYLERIATGFPSFLFEHDDDIKHFDGGNTNSDSAKKWWTKWWDRDVVDSDGKDGWQLQADFLRKIVERMDNHTSTLGYEILSEPHVYSSNQWEKIGTFNSYMTDYLRNYTNKTLVYSMNIPVDLDSDLNLTPENLAKMAPKDKNDVVFKISVYGHPERDDYQKERFNLFLDTSQLAKVPLYIGEWNDVVRTKDGGVYKINPSKSDISQTDVNKFLNTFKDAGIWGTAYWKWDYNDDDIPNFNLISATENGIKQTKYFDQLKEAIEELYPQDQ